MSGLLVKPTFGRLVVFLWLLVVVSVSSEAGARPGWVTALAASPERVREGRLWYLISSAILVDRPVVLSLVFFGALAALALGICGMRTFWTSAVLGQVVATLLVYCFVGVARWLVAGAFDSSIESPDYGVSTISAAWLGSIAAVAWCRRGRSSVGRLSIALSCIAVGLFAYSVRPEVTVLSSEHLIAFSLGILAAAPAVWQRLLSDAYRRRLHRFPVAIAMALGLFVAIIAAPTGLAALRHEIALHLPPTGGRCASDWNHFSAASRPRVPERSASIVWVGTTRLFANGHPAISVNYCRFAFIGGSKVVGVLGVWRHGGIVAWISTVSPRPSLPLSGDAVLRGNGQIRLVRSRRQVVLAS
jgi:hypothetical protein